ncbi:MAG: hypothetical protein NZ824_05475 [Candidatus Thioglobus sp.]|nr:hypothetical protein [Candidatus Thioglobus sp.]
MTVNNQFILGPNGNISHRGAVEEVEEDPIGDMEAAYYHLTGKPWTGNNKGLSLWASKVRLNANTFGDFKEGDRKHLDRLFLTERNSGNITTKEAGNEAFGNEIHMDDVKNFIAEEAFPALGAIGGHFLGKGKKLMTGLGALTGEGVRSTATDANKGGELDKGGIVSNAITSGVEYSILDALQSKLGKTKLGKTVSKYAKPVAKGSASRAVPVLSALWPGELGGGLDKDGISRDMVNPNREPFEHVDWEKFREKNNGDQ